MPKSYPLPPKFPARILKKFYPRHDTDFMDGDLHEIFLDICEERGLSAANRWFWAQSIVTLIPLLYHHLLWSVIMFGNYLKTALRNFRRQKLYTLINVFGLSIGVAGCILVMLYVRFEWSFDKFHRNGNRLYRMVEIEKNPDGQIQRNGFQPMPLAPALAAEYPEIESYARLMRSSGTVIFENRIHTENFLFVDSTFLHMFTFPLVRGLTDEALKSRNTIVITERMADKYFGRFDPLGQQLHLKFWQGEADFEVTGVAAAVPENSSLTFDFLIPIVHFPGYERKLTQWSVYNGSTFVQVRQSTDIQGLEAKLKPFIGKYYTENLQSLRERGRLSPDDDAFKLSFQPLKDVHLDSSVSRSPEDVSNPLYTYILGGIALLILAVACINFVNLAVARSASRAKEVGIRKVLGAQRTNLMQQFFGETLLLCILAFVAGLILSHMFLPFFNRMSEKPLSLELIPNMSLALLFVGLVLVVSVMAGSYPAVLLSRFQPATVLKRKIKIGSPKAYCSGLVVFQFGLSIFLIVCALCMKSQHSFLLNKNLGYVPEQVLVLETHTNSDEGQIRIDRLREELRGRAGFVSISGTNNAFAKGWDFYGFEHNGIQRSAFVYRADFDYLDTLGIELLEGRNFDPEMRTDAEEAIIVNKTLVKEFGWTEPVLGARLSGWNEELVPGGPVVIGVMKDYHFLSLRENIAPAFLTMDPGFGIYHALIRFNTENVQGFLSDLRRAWKQVAPDAPFAYSFFDENLRQQYESEMRWEKIITFVSGMAVLLACLGIYGLAVHTLFRRSKEMGIRKILGASFGRIFSLLTRSFLIQVLLANALAWPLAWFVMDRWLKNFAYHIRLNILVFVFAGAIALVISLITVGTQAIKAALSDPVETLRFE